MVLRSVLSVSLFLDGRSPLTGEKLPQLAQLCDSLCGGLMAGLPHGSGPAHSWLEECWSPVSPTHAPIPSPPHRNSGESSYDHTDDPDHHPGSREATGGTEKGDVNSDPTAESKDNPNSPDSLDSPNVDAVRVWREAAWQLCGPRHRRISILKYLYDYIYSPIPQSGQRGGHEGSENERKREGNGDASMSGSPDTTKMSCLRSCCAWVMAMYLENPDDPDDLNIPSASLASSPE